MRISKQAQHDEIGAATARAFQQFASRYESHASIALDNVKPMEGCVNVFRWRPGVGLKGTEGEHERVIFEDRDGEIVVLAAGDKRGYEIYKKFSKRRDWITR